MENPFSHLSKWQLYAVIGGGTLIAGYAEYKHHQSTGSWSPFATAPAAASSPGGSGIDPVTNLPYSDDSVTDPETGLTYLAEAQEYGSVTAAEASVSQYGQSTASGSGIGVNPASPPSSGSVNTTVGSSIYTSNAAWATAVEAGLGSINPSNPGQYDGTDIGEAIGAYLQGQPLTPGQAQVVSVALAEFGDPPVGTFQIILAPAAPTGPSTGTSPSTPLTVSLPNGQGGFENIVFPSQDAYTQWQAWNANFASTHGGRTQAYRSEWNAELTSLGATGMIPIATYNPNAPLGSPANDGNPNDYM